jgi:hypothetical protein
MKKDKSINLYGNVLSTSNIFSKFLGLQMWLNLKPYSNQLYNRKSLLYTIGITGYNELIDQSRNAITIRPGRQTAIKVIPRLVRTSAAYNSLGVNQRRCKLPDERDGLQFVTNYTRLGCETDCAIQKATSLCKCLPWQYPSNFTKWPLCDMFGSHCFDYIMSVNNNYLECKSRCFKDCQETEYIVLPAVFPISYLEACRPTSYLYKHFEHNLRKHFAFSNYKILVKDGIVPPDMDYGLSNGTFCIDYFQNYVAFVTIDGPSSAAILTTRDTSLDFYLVLSTLGGHFGLFAGMSVLGMAEVVILFLTLMYQLWRKCLCPHRIIREMNNQTDEDKKIESMADDIEVSNF